LLFSRYRTCGYRTILPDLGQVKDGSNCVIGLTGYLHSFLLERVNMDYWDIRILLSIL
jgi:hypothetical protein